MGTGSPNALVFPASSLAAAQHEVQPFLKAARLVRGPVLVGHPGGERLVHEGVQLGVALAEDGRVIRVGGYALQAEQQHLHGRLNVRVRIEVIDTGPYLQQFLKIRIQRGVAGIGPTAQPFGERLAAADGLLGDLLKRGVIEIHVGQRGEQRPHRKVVRILIDNALGAGLERRAGQQPQRMDHMVLKIGYRGLLAANPHDRTARAFRGLFTLIAKHGKPPGLGVECHRLYTDLPTLSEKDSDGDHNHGPSRKKSCAGRAVSSA